MHWRSREYSWRSPGFPQGEDNPVTIVSWNDAIAYCNALSEQEGLRPYYRVAGGRTTILGGEGYRLPTEAEWEYACRAGNPARFSFGPDEDRLRDYAWIERNADHKTHPVMQKPGNPFGLFDMHGNVWEWCWDAYKPDYYKESPVTDPSGPGDSATRAYRGGGWSLDERFGRSAFRNYGPPNDSSASQGFRVARTPAGF
jgi:formylglycine-generating enzyme required for sulfatase activity